MEELDKSKCFYLPDLRFPTFNGHHNPNRDLGNIYDRKYRDVYVSSVYDAGEGVTWKKIEWEAEFNYDGKGRPK